MLYITKGSEILTQYSVWVYKKNQIYQVSISLKISKIDLICRPFDPSNKVNNNSRDGFRGSPGAMPPSSEGIFGSWDFDGGGGHNILHWPTCSSYHFASENIIFCCWNPEKFQIQPHLPPNRDVYRSLKGWGGGQNIWIPGNTFLFSREIYFC